MFLDGVRFLVFGFLTARLVAWGDRPRIRAIVFVERTTVILFWIQLHVIVFEKRFIIVVFCVGFLIDWLHFSKFFFGELYTQ
jgi:hypothetical protein